MPDERLVTLGRGLREARKRRGLSQEQLSELTGVSTRHIGGIENAEINPSFEVLATLLDFLGASYDSILHPATEQQQREIQEITDLYMTGSKEEQKVLLATIRALGRELREIESSASKKEKK